MKAAAKRFFSVLLFLSFLACLSGCAKVDPSFLTGKVTEMIDLSISHDVDGKYALLHPGVTDRETFGHTDELLREYFPVVAGYSCEMQQYNQTKGINNDLEVYEGLYLVQFEGQSFRIIARWRSDPEGSGFTEYRIFNEEDWQAAQKK